VEKLAGAIGVDPGQLVEASPAGRSELVDAGAEGGPFTAVFEQGEQGWWVATCPEIPEAITQGRTVEEARENLKDAIRLELEIRREEAEEELAGREVIRERIAL
jgi:predicted RNase H-like HicB family nuclease